MHLLLGRITGRHCQVLVNPERLSNKVQLCCTLENTVILCNDWYLLLIKRLLLFVWYACSEVVGVWHPLYKTFKCLEGKSTAATTLSYWLSTCSLKYGVNVVCARIPQWVLFCNVVLLRYIKYVSPIRSKMIANLPGNTEYTLFKLIPQYTDTS